MGEGHHWSRELLRMIYGKKKLLKDDLEMVQKCIKLLKPKLFIFKKWDG